MPREKGAALKLNEPFWAIIDSKGEVDGHYEGDLTGPTKRDALYELDWCLKRCRSPKNSSGEAWGRPLSYWLACKLKKVVLRVLSK